MPQATSLAIPMPEPRLHRSMTSFRTLFSMLMSILTGLIAIFAFVPLLSVLFMLIWRGIARLNLAIFTELPPAAGMTGGGFGNAIMGTIVMVGVAALIAVPFGTLAAVQMSEFGRNSSTSSVVRFCAKVLTGLPSILAGVFAYATIVLLMGTFSAVAGGIALSILMIPIVMLTAEEALRQVPMKVREAALGMGATRTQMVWKVVLPTALPGMLTGVMLAVARAAGETAPLLFTALFNQYWFDGNLAQPTASLAVLIYNFSSVPFKNQVELAWCASLVLVMLVLAVNLIGQRITRSSR
ncbi:phosphate ABC transporter permease PstA [Kolteria novifilia]